MAIKCCNSCIAERLKEAKSVTRLYHIRSKILACLNSSRDGMRMTLTDELNETRRRIGGVAVVGRLISFTWTKDADAGVGFSSPVPVQ